MRETELLTYLAQARVLVSTADFLDQLMNRNTIANL